jgi:integrase/recombinase XerD
MNLKSQVEDFLVFLEQGDYSPNTVRNYASVLRRLAAKHNDVSKDSVKMFYDNEIIKKGRNTKTLYYAALNKFFNYLIEEAQVISENPLIGNRIAKPKQPRPVPRNLAPTTAGVYRRKIRRLELFKRAPLTLIAYGGLRADEVVKLSIDSIVLLDSEIQLTIVGKGAKVRVLPFYSDTEVYKVLSKHYLSEKAMRGAGPLFLNYFGQPLIYKTLNEWWRENITPSADLHQFRHTVANEMVESGLDILTVGWFLGHEDIQTTKRYVNKSKVIMNKEIERYQRGK